MKQRKLLKRSMIVLMMTITLLAIIAFAVFAGEGPLFVTGVKSGTEIQSVEDPGEEQLFSDSCSKGAVQVMNRAAKTISVNDPAATEVTANVVSHELQTADNYETSVESVQDSRQTASAGSGINAVEAVFNFSETEIEESAERPGTPTITSVVNNLKNTVRLTWTTVSDATGYGIFRLNDKGNFWECLKAVDGKDTTSASVSGLPANKGSTFRVAAVKTTGRVTVQGVKSDAVSVYVTGANGRITDKMLKKNSIDSCSKLMIVAHPDDETLWGGGHMISGDWFIVCLTNGDNKVRSKEYQNVLKYTNNKGLILNYPDMLKGGTRSWWTKEDGDVRADLNKLINYKDWDMIVTHNPDGGTGHQHHKLTCAKVTDICQVNGLMDKLWYHGIFYPKGRVPDGLPRLSAAQEAFKRNTLKLYKNEQKSIALFWDQMIPYEDWILSTNWGKKDETLADTNEAGAGAVELPEGITAEDLCNSDDVIADEDGSVADPEALEQVEKDHSAVNDDSGDITMSAASAEEVPGSEEAASRTSSESVQTVTESGASAEEPATDVSDQQ